MSIASIPLVLCGPILRRYSPKSFWIWMLVGRELKVQANVYKTVERSNKSIDRAEIVGGGLAASQRICDRAYLVMLQVKPLAALRDGFPENTTLLYELLVVDDNTSRPLFTKEELTGRLLERYGDLSLLTPPASAAGSLLVAMGSCRNLDQSDSCIGLAKLRAEVWDRRETRPHMIVLMGDQVYCDDLTEKTYDACKDLSGRVFGSLPRDKALLSLTSGQKVAFIRTQLTAAKGPFGVSPDPERHLLGFAEICALYLLYWSSAAWRLLSLTPPADTRHWELIFSNTITYFSGDDHEITDDYGFDAQWQKAITESTKVRRFAANGTLAYLIFQGYGNDPAAFGNLKDDQSFIRRAISGAIATDEDLPRADDAIMSRESWSYVIPANCAMVVLDSRLARADDPATGKTRAQEILSAGKIKEYPQLRAKFFSAVALNALLRSAKETSGGNTLHLFTPTPVFGQPAVERMIRNRVDSRDSALVYDYENWKSNPRNYLSLADSIERSGFEACSVYSGDVHYAFLAKGTIAVNNRTIRVSQACASALANPIPAAAQFVLEGAPASKEVISYIWRRFDDSWKLLLGYQPTEVDSNYLFSKHGKPTLVESLLYQGLENDSSSTISFASNLALILISRDATRSTLLSLSQESRLPVIATMISN